MFNFARKKSSTQVEVKEYRNGSDTVLENGNGRPHPNHTSTNGTSRSHHENGRPLERYYLRGIIAILCPIIITAYWYIVWFVYLIPSDPGTDLFFGHSGAIYVFYSWFLIGIFGLGISEYGMVGIEASMMMEKRWAAKNAMQVMMHADHSWAGPSGWLQVVMDMFVRGKNKPEPPTPLWSILAFFSFLPFVALPLTGLSMELKDGYHTTNQRPLVQGLRYENFNEVTGAGVGARSWSSGVAPALPQRGVIYTKEGVGRSTVDYLSKFPNMLPNNTKGITEAFLTPQSMLPMSGRSFGLLVSYDCTPIYKLSDFTILNKRRPNQEMAPQSYSDENDSSYYITIRNSTNAPDDTLAANFGAVLEEGISLWNGSDTVTDDPQGRVSNDCYFWDHNNANQYPGMDYVSVYEAILWQIVASTKPEDFDEVGLPRMDVKYNLTLAGNITELYGQYKNEYFDDDGNLEQTDYYSAIGARCTSSSAVGMADIDGPASTYSNFVRGDTPPADSATCMPRVDTAVPAGLMSLAMASDDFDTGDVSGDWIQNMFRSVNLAVPLTIPLTKSTLVNASNPEESLAGESFTIQLDYMQDVDFRDTLLRTFPAYVNEMMYNGGLSFSNSSGEQPIYFSHPNTTAFVAQKLFETGTINLWIPGAMLILWTVGTIVLAVMYGFRRRWAVELDGYSMFRFGADYAERVRERPEFGVNMPYEDCYLLKDIPGMIGDARPHMDTEPGKITLVQGGGEFLADKSKEYM